MLSVLFKKKTKNKKTLDLLSIKVFTDFLQHLFSCSWHGYSYGVIQTSIFSDVSDEFPLHRQ